VKRESKKLRPVENTRPRNIHLDQMLRKCHVAGFVGTEKRQTLKRRPAITRGLARSYFGEVLEGDVDEEAGGLGWAGR
jgi:hypothetical protein